jgi:hypothetical protein
MLLHKQMAQHIDHIEWGGEPDQTGFLYRTGSKILH